MRSLKLAPPRQHPLTRTLRQEKYNTSKTFKTMPKIIQRTAYAFDELADRALGACYGSSPRERALSKMFELCEVDLSDVESEFRKKLSEEYAFDVGDIRYDLSCSQGSGASFTGFTDGSEKGCKKFWEAIGSKVEGYPPSLSVELGSLSNHYAHYNTVKAHIMDVSDELETVADNLEKAAEDWKNDRCRELYRDLQKSHDSQTSQEVLEAMAREYDFDESGSII